jgi:L-iditol 2-dehydrogenase
MAAPLEENIALVLHKIDDLRLEPFPVSEPKDGEILLEMQSVGICGSDVHYWKRGCIGDFVVRAPMVLGHESSGKVLKVGPNVKNLKEGDRVTIEPGVPCRRCDFCKTGRYNLCPDIVFLATPPVHGSLARYHTHAADFCFKLPDHVTYEEGAFCEPLSVGVHACRRAGVTIGTTIFITGAGPIGLVSMLAAKAMGAETIIMTDISQARLDFAKKVGATHVVLADKDPQKTAQIVTETLGCMPNISIECSGAESSIQATFYATISGGVVVLVGLGRPLASLPIVNAAVREIDIRGVFRYANCYPAALSLIASGRIDVKPLITHRYNITESVQAFEMAESGEAIKVMIQCGKEIQH